LLNVIKNSSYLAIYSNMLI